jgi:hypothetical protein
MSKIFGKLFWRELSKSMLIEAFDFLVSGKEFANKLTCCTLAGIFYLLATKRKGRVGFGVKYYL